MDVAVHGDRGCVLSAQVAHATYVFAVAHGFGAIDGTAPAQLALAKLRSEFEARARYHRLHRARPKTAAACVAAAFSRVNAQLYSRSASHEDYVAAGCSLCAVLIVEARAYLANIGITRVLLTRDGGTVELAAPDAFESANGAPVLMRAVGVGAEVEIPVCSFDLHAGDQLVLTGGSGTARSDGLIVRYERDGEADGRLEGRPRAWLMALNGVCAAAAFFTALCLR